MKILFHTNQIAERGTEIVIYDYAEGNETILGGTSLIAAPSARVFDATVLERFRKRFEVFLYDDPEELDGFIADRGIELFYQISSGEKEERLVTAAPVFVHCVFSTEHRYGAYYCPISDFLNRYYRTRYPVLPHIVKKFPGTDANLRDELGIPKQANVFGGYGGKGQFDIEFVKETVVLCAKDNPAVYFIFMNFTPFASNISNIIFLPGNTSIDYKERFINTCDAMLHARSDGETFGLSVAEFSVKNKPILTWKPDLLHNTRYVIRDALRRLRGRKHRYATAHLDFLGDAAIVYHTARDLRRKILRFDPKKYEGRDLDRYSTRFSAENVMRTFEKIVTGTKDAK